MNSMKDISFQSIIRGMGGQSPRNMLVQVPWAS